MSNITKIKNKIADQHKAIERLTADRAAAQAAIDGADAHLETLEQLKAQRRTLRAEALIAKKTANTSAIDAQIANAEKQHEAAQTAAETSRDALDIYDEGLRIAEAELNSLSEQYRAAIAAEIMAQHDAGLAKYLAAVAAMEEGVAVMAGAEQAWRHARASLDHAAFPDRGSRVLEDLRSNGVRVPYTASRLADPKIAATYTPDYPDYWFHPAWADPLTEGLGVREAAALVDELRKLGVDCEEPARPVPAVSRIKVRIRKGTINADPEVIRSAKTGEVVDRREVSFGPGEDVLIDEPTARYLRERNMVLIHGEDEMPELTADAVSPKVIAPVPEDAPRTVELFAPRDYQGNFHRLDMSGHN
ncbi:HlyD family secretion protein [Paraburkholderia tropica]|uniref:hypothetical protein n=1 Tax=Paraburkholderia tropica TaxID=92647 RepID=UPI002ABD90CE|nr:hypothetical protein [Paraburkholderia tropica]